MLGLKIIHTSKKGMESQISASESLIQMVYGVGYTDVYYECTEIYYFQD